MNSRNSNAQQKGSSFDPGSKSPGALISPQHPEFAISLLGTDPGWDLYVGDHQCAVVWPVGGDIVCRVRGTMMRIPRFAFLISRLCSVRGRGEGMFAFIETTRDFLDRGLRESEVEVPLGKPNFWFARPRGRHLDLARFYVVSLWQEFQQQLPHFHLAIHSNFCSLLCHLLRDERTLDGLDPFEVAEFQRDTTEAKVFSLIARLRKEYTRRWTLRDLCRESGVNRTTLNTVFRHATGYSPVAFIQHLRINRAQEILRTTQIPVEEIAGQVGYNDERHFHRLFKNVTGLTPGIYRKLYGG
jgi:AraC-like DNA-binding protein